MTCAHAGCLASIMGPPTVAMCRKLASPGWRWPRDGRQPAVKRTLCPVHAPVEVRP